MASCRDPNSRVNPGFDKWDSVSEQVLLLIGKSSVFISIPVIGPTSGKNLRVVNTDVFTFKQEASIVST
jgi:hypothetical protein